MTYAKARIKRRSNTKAETKRLSRPVQLRLVLATKEGNEAALSFVHDEPEFFRQLVDDLDTVVLHRVAESD